MSKVTKIVIAVVVVVVIVLAIKFGVVPNVFPTSTPHG